MIKVGLLVFVLASVGFLVVKEMGAARVVGAAPGGTSSLALAGEESEATNVSPPQFPPGREAATTVASVPNVDPPTTSLRRSPPEIEAATSTTPDRSSDPSSNTMGAVPPVPAVAAVAVAAVEGPPPLDPRTREAPGAAGQQASRSSRETRVVHVTYFFTTARCTSCIMLESMTDAALVTAFAGPLADGRMEWHLVNVDRPENRHFVTHYGLYTKSVVVSEMDNGREVRWKNLPDVWRLLNDPDGFQRYIVSEVEAFLGGA
jgi:hypothetical protein